MPTIITDRDRGYRKLLNRVKRAARPQAITVGIHGEDGGAGHEESGLTVGDIASIHEFGLGNHPQRSFIRAWADAERTENERILRQLGRSVVKGANTVDQGLQKAAIVLEASCQKRLHQHSSKISFGFACHQNLKVP